jgi:arylsulfatase A-like enzyme
MFILADDLGYNELNFMNDTRGILTPNLDKLAHAGVIMKNYYVQPICSPTRSGKSLSHAPAQCENQTFSSFLSADDWALHHTPWHSRQCDLLGHALGSPNQ